MATVKIKSPKSLTGNTSVDMQEMRNYQVYLASQLNYILNNLDEENLLISTSTNESEEE